MEGTQPADEDVTATPPLPAPLQIPKRWSLPAMRPKHGVPCTHTKGTPSPPLFRAASACLSEILQVWRGLAQRKATNQSGEQHVNNLATCNEVRKR